MCFFNTWIFQTCQSYYFVKRKHLHLCKTRYYFFFPLAVIIEIKHIPKVKICMIQS